MDFREIGAPGSSGASIPLTRLQSRVGRFFLQLLCPGAWAEHPLQGRVGMQCGWGGSDPDTSQGTLGPCHKVSATLKGQHVQRCLAVGPYFADFTLVFSSVLKQAFAKYPFWKSR